MVCFKFLASWRIHIHNDFYKTIHKCRPFYSVPHLLNKCVYPNRLYSSKHQSQPLVTDSYIPFSYNVQKFLEVSTKSSLKIVKHMDRCGERKSYNGTQNFLHFRRRNRHNI